jgi:hypothetical protein
MLELDDTTFDIDRPLAALSRTRTGTNVAVTRSSARETERSMRRGESFDAHTPNVPA